jgi:prepilin-type N-terminal cleavage/methylation domain-containing protein
MNRNLAPQTDQPVPGRAARRRRGGRAGFSLIEVLVAMTILGVITLMLLTVFNQTARSWRFGQDSIDVHQTSRSILDQIATELSQAVTSSNITFYGTKERICFVTPIITPEVDVVADLHELCYELDNSTKTIVRQATPPTMQNINSGTWNIYTPAWYNTMAESKVMAKIRVFDLTFTYYGKTGPGSTSVGQTTTLPAAVQIEISMVGERAAVLLTNVPSGSIAEANVTNEHLIRLYTLMYLRNAHE